MKDPAYDLRSANRDEVVHLFEQYHGYKSVSGSMTYCFAVFEDSKPIAAYAWQPPPPGAAKAVCPEAPYGVLALSRMVAVPKHVRRLKHVSKPLRRQMNRLIDRTRWPALVTYSDEGQGHNGFVYECSGWIKTVRNRAPVNVNAAGARCSPYSAGERGTRDLVQVGHTWIQRWENYVCERGHAATWIANHGWQRVALPGKTWASGNQAYTYVRREICVHASLRALGNGRCVLCDVGQLSLDNMNA